MRVFAPTFCRLWRLKRLLASGLLLSPWYAMIMIYNYSNNLIVFQATSSCKMEPMAAKSLVVNVAIEHGLVIDSLTTDRSTDMKSMMRCFNSRVLSEYD